MSQFKRNEELLRDYGFLIGHDIYDPRTNREYENLDKRTRRYKNLVNDIADAIREDERQREVRRERFHGSIDPDLDVWLPNMVEYLRPLEGKTVLLKWNNQIEAEFIVPNDNARLRRILQGKGFVVKSDLTIFQEYQNTFNVSYDEIPKTNVYIVNQVQSVRRRQQFREGLDHCVFEPIKEWALQVKENAKTKSTQRTYNAIYNKCLKLEQEYNNGVPEEDIQTICNILQVGLDVTIPLINENYIECRSMKRPLKIFRFINTRLNHVDLGSVVCGNNTITFDTYEELEDKRAELDNDNEYYVYTRCSKHISSITTLHNRYTVECDYQTEKNKFEFENNIMSYKIDDIKDKELSYFIRCGTHYNETVDFKPPIRGQTFHIDQEKAYFNFHICKYYNGLLGKITDYRKCDTMLRDDKGFIPALYRIYKLDFTNCKHTKLLRKLKCYQDFNVYPSCELEFLLDMGITFQVYEGCWGVERLDFRFPEEFKKKDGKVSYYARYVGSCDSHHLEKRLWLKGGKDFFENIQSHTGKRVMYNDELNEGCIEFKKKHNFHFGHLTAFITSLQRINCIQQMMLFDYDNLVRVCVDGIYYTGYTPKLINLFRVKDDYNFNNEAGNEYCSGVYIEDFDIIKDDGDICSDLPEYKENRKEELHLGAGGTGKTHINLTDKGFQRILYVAPTYKLASCKRTDYGVDSTCWEQLLTKDPNIWRKYQLYYNTLLFDEVSMMNTKQLDIIRERFKSCKVIFCGDIGYQLPCFSKYGEDNKNVEVSDFKYTIEYERNYRVKCEKLSLLLSTLRKNMTIWGGRQCLEYVLNHYKEQVISQVEGYDIQDYILTYTNSMKDTYTEKFKGKFGDKEKFIFKERYGEYCNGSIDILPVDNDVKGKKEIRHAFTIHSIQGETVPEDKKLFIDTHLFETSPDGKLLYTAISRAKRLSQIYFIH